MNLHKVHNTIEDSFRAVQCIMDLDIMQIAFIMSPIFCYNVHFLTRAIKI